MHRKCEKLLKEFVSIESQLTYLLTIFKKYDIIYYFHTKNEFIIYSYARNLLRF